MLAAKPCTAPTDWPREKPSAPPQRRWHGQQPRGQKVWERVHRVHVLDRHICEVHTTSADVDKYLSRAGGLQFESLELRCAPADDMASGL